MSGGLQRVFVHVDFHRDGNQPPAHLSLGRYFRRGEIIGICRAAPAAEGPLDTRELDLIPTCGYVDLFSISQLAFGVIQAGERKRFAMRGIALRSDFDAMKLRAVARVSRNGAQTRRLLALAAIYDRATRSEAAKLAGVTPQIVRDWVVRFNAEGPDGLIDRTSPGLV
jgi:hypothetical protein